MRIDENLIAEIVRLKEVIKQSVNAVLDEKLTASHLASDVYALLDALDMMENQWRPASSASDSARAAQEPPTAVPSAGDSARMAQEPPAAAPSAGDSAGVAQEPPAAAPAEGGSAGVAQEPPAAAPAEQPPAENK